MPARFLSVLSTIDCRTCALSQSVSHPQERASLNPAKIRNVNANSPLSAGSQQLQSESPVH